MSAARVPAKPLGEDGILNQNPIFEMGSSLMSTSKQLQTRCISFARYGMLKRLESAILTQENRH
jgi:hypothetical protein